MAELVSREEAQEIIALAKKHEEVGRRYPPGELKKYLTILSLYAQLEAKPSDAKLRDENDCLTENLARVQKHLQAVVAERDGLNERVETLEAFARSIPGVVARMYAKGHYCHECISCRGWDNNQDESDHSRVKHFPNCLWVRAQDALAPQGEQRERADELVEAHQRLLDEEHYRLMAESHGEP